ncbi:MAG: aminoacyl-histidine dipeptidase [Eubacteriales bacterium]|nr:aminoacyl-histidine dipeptidase [Eubacteriales bacterium]
MAVLENLEPSRVFHYFEEIANIPHGSYHTKEISDYLAAFAVSHGLKYRQDEANNVIIWKDAAPGYENAPAVILQGHCDMVCEKVPDSNHDFTKDPLELMVEGDYITANGTTLGGDDGIAVAYALAILEDNSLRHPPLEVVITTDEEVGLLGAAALDMSDLKGKFLINMDSEEEGYLCVGCAGGLGAACELEVTYVAITGTKLEITIDGLVGGHSGAEIDKNRANANKLMGRFLYELGQKTEYMLASLEGGTKGNAITRTATAVIVVEPGREAEVQEAAAILEKHLRKEYSGSDEGITIHCRNLGSGEADVLHPISREKVVFLLNFAPWGVQKMSGDIPGLVETSANPGILKLDAEKFLLDVSIRSSVGSAKEAVAEKVRYLTEFLGGICTVGEGYPAWEYRKDSALREIMKETYAEMFGKEPVVNAIHAGLECGLFYEKSPELDCVSFGPDMKDIHTTEEKLSISSTERMWRYLLKVLERIK